MSYQALHLEPDEQVILEVRKHWIVFAVYAVGLFLAGLLPPAALTFLKIFTPQIFNVNISGNTGTILLFFYLLWFLVLWILFFINWTTYYFDVWYVTKKRIIAVEQYHLFDREISNLRFDKIQDVSIETQGIISTFLDFGNIRVQTASENANDFAMKTVRHPDQVKRIIFGQQNKAQMKVEF